MCLACSVREGGHGHHRAASGGDPHPHRKEHRHLRGQNAQGAFLRGHWLEQVTGVTATHEVFYHCEGGWTEEGTETA